MCLIVFAWQKHPRLPLLLAANRDEFHERPAAPAAYWNDTPQVLAGRDLQAGGTWLGISRSGRFAAITNVRDPAAHARSAPRSRGELTHDFLAGTTTPSDYLLSVANRMNEYQGFNLLVGDRESLWYLNGSAAEKSQPMALAPGIYGLSNAALDVPWPKVNLARNRLLSALDDSTGERKAPGHSELRSCLADRSLADQHALDEENLGGDMARQLSAQFIVTPHYGTRCCTTLRSHLTGELEFEEQRFDSAGNLAGTEAFKLDTGGER
ncbi:NRDE family protein [Congregibacter brevis]|uniref:NRDE family protein n=1 Tax=Congregibacter brevis TaxID=3081201 RepID=A0ABZ0IEJ7_9GAMM|nr:NRDE family protein [Congregibacter sp. IMCC45268]